MVKSSTSIGASLRLRTLFIMQSPSSSTPSPDSPASETSTESLMHLLQQCEPKVASSIKETVDRHKKELLELEEELQSRVASVASHRVKIERLQAELALLSTQELGLQHALASDLPAAGDTNGLEGSGSPSPLEGVKRSKSELVLRRTPREEVLDPLSADEREHYRHRRMNLSLSLDPLASPNSTLNTEETFHTATSSPKKFPEWAPAGDTTPTSPDTTGPAGPPQPQFRLGPVPTADDSDDMSSTEDYHKPRIVEGQSSSSVERSPEERHQRAKYKRRVPGEGKPGRRQVTEVEALRAMQRLCSRIASQKMLVLQELQKKYVRLEMALQYSFFDNQSRRPMMVTPIQETPSLTLSESDMQIATEEPPSENGHVEDPLLHRLKEQELEGSDNVSTSNDELPGETHEPPWEDPLRCRGRSDYTESTDRLDRLDRRLDRIEHCDRDPPARDISNMVLTRSRSGESRGEQTQQELSVTAGPGASTPAPESSSVRVTDTGSGSTATTNIDATLKASDTKSRRSTYSKKKRLAELQARKRLAEMELRQAQAEVELQEIQLQRLRVEAESSDDEEVMDDLASRDPRRHPEVRLAPPHDASGGRISRDAAHAARATYTGAPAGAQPLRDDDGYSKVRESVCANTKGNIASEVSHGNVSDKLIDVRTLAAALAQVMRSSRQPPKFMQRLPVFDGKPENIARIRLSLRGAAKEAVGCLLFSQSDPQAILDALERRFGRPEALIMTEIRESKIIT
ncbi:hypothetical protein SFRURICE_000256 [Spodoptera frugiperda]|nr:hypothetical protein SFRURICE_000256 [Spodoptera frugiperda]